jgi:UDP-glucose 4-epimerase
MLTPGSFVPPPHSIGRAEFVRADIRNPMIGRIITQAKVDTVVHMNVLATPTAAGGRVSQKEINVIGTMQLLAACQKATSVKRLVVKSTAAIYGSSPRDPALFTEDTGPKTMPTSGFGKDSVEVEGYVRGFSRRRPDAEITLLRFANVIGPGIKTAMTDYFVADPAGAHGLRRPAAVRPRDVRRRHVVGGPRAGGPDRQHCRRRDHAHQAAAMVGGPPPIPPRRHTLVARAPRRARRLLHRPAVLPLPARGLDTTRMREVMKFTPSHHSRSVLDFFERSPCFRAPTRRKPLGRAAKPQSAGDRRPDPSGGRLMPGTSRTPSPRPAPESAASGSTHWSRPTYAAPAHRRAPGAAPARPGDSDRSERDGDAAP